MSSPGYRGNKGSKGEVCNTTDEKGDLRSVAVKVQTQADQASDMSKTALVRVKWLDGTTLSVRLYDDELVGDLIENIKRHFYNAGDGCPTFRNQGYISTSYTTITLIIEGSKPRSEWHSSC